MIGGNGSRWIWLLALWALGCDSGSSGPIGAAEGGETSASEGGEDDASGGDEGAGTDSAGGGHTDGGGGGEGGPHTEGAGEGEQGEGEAGEGEGEGEGEEGESPCVPQCVNKACGNDSCGGSCGNCASGEACTSDGECKPLAPAKDCDSLSCDTNAYCVEDSPGEPRCECKQGFEGNGLSCWDIDECEEKNGGCSDLAFCDNQIGAAPICTCMPGWTGNGKQCIDLDECSAGGSNCPTNSACINTRGGFQCVCAPGFQMSIGVCVDIDECKGATQPCDANATCKNVPGGFECECKPGFQGNGFFCSTAGGCGGNCDKNAQCAAEAGQAPSCVCAPGFSGSGTSCYPVPSRVDMKTVLILPWDPSDGKTWDGGVFPENKKLDVEKLITKGVEFYLTNNPVALASIVVELGSFLSSTTDPPDPFGTAELKSQGQGSVKQLAKINNTLSPSWPNVFWTPVVIDATTHLTLHLWDSDLAFDDQIGSVSIGAADLLKAQNQGGVMAIPTNTQGAGTIIFVEVLVTPIYACGNGQCDTAAGENATVCPQDCGGGGGGHFCDANCGGNNGKAQNDPALCWCDAECKQFGDCCNGAGSGPGGGACTGSSCAQCK